MTVLLLIKAVVVVVVETGIPEVVRALVDEAGSVLPVFALVGELVVELVVHGCGGSDGTEVAGWVDGKRVEFPTTVMSAVTVVVAYSKLVGVPQLYNTHKVDAWESVTVTAQLFDEVEVDNVVPEVTVEFVVAVVFEVVVEFVLNVVVKPVVEFKVKLVVELVVELAVELVVEFPVGFVAEVVLVLVPEVEEELPMTEMGDAGVDGEVVFVAPGALPVVELGIPPVGVTTREACDNNVFGDTADEELVVSEEPGVDCVEF